MDRTRVSAVRFCISKKTRSTSDSQRTISAKAHGIGANFPGQSVRSCGQASHVAACGSHSAGMRYFGRLEAEERGLGRFALKEFTRRSIDPPLKQRAIGIDAAVAEKRPVTPYLFHTAEIALHDQGFLF